MLNAQRPTWKWLSLIWGARAPRSPAMAPRRRKLLRSRAHHSGTTAESFGEGAETSERGARAPRKVAITGGDFALTWPRECRFVDRADRCADDNQLDEAADA